MFVPLNIYFLNDVSGQGEFSKWRKLDSRNFGLARSMISLASWTVLKNLREKGASLVCVRCNILYLSVCLEVWKTLTFL